jgi:hypothetical protein
MTNIETNTPAAGIRDDDVVIGLAETLPLMGGISISTAYDDPELMALKIDLSATGQNTKIIRFVKRKVLELRAKRVARSEANTAAIRAQIEKRLALRREKCRMRAKTNSK